MFYGDFAEKQKKIKIKIKIMIVVRVRELKRTMKPKKKIWKSIGTNK